MNHPSGLRSNRAVVAAKLAARVDDAAQPEQAASPPRMETAADVGKRLPLGKLIPDQEALAVPAMPQPNGPQDAAVPTDETRLPAPAGEGLVYRQATTPNSAQISHEQ